MQFWNSVRPKWAFDRAPHAPAAGAPIVAMFNEKLQVHLLFLRDTIAARVLGVFSKYSFVYPAIGRILRRFGMPFAAPGMGFWPSDVQPDG